MVTIYHSQALHCGYISAKLGGAELLIGEYHQAEPQLLAGELYAPSNDNYKVSGHDLDELSSNVARLLDNLVKVVLE